MITIEPPQSIAGSSLSAITKPTVARFLARAQKAIGFAGEVHVLLADDATLKRLNKTFRGKNKATDVLSFPAGPSTVFFGEPEGPELVGDLAVSLETAARQAARFGHTLADEVRILLLHGLLHLAGFDHENDSGEMAAREAELRHRLGLPTGLIARVVKPAAHVTSSKPGALRRARA
jgi:probable rRNA maturation factor